MKERLQKILSSAGICSRRSAEDYLEAGRVTVDGKVAAVGDKADLETEKVAVDGVIIPTKDQCTYLMLFKPRGYVTTLSDEKGRKTVADLVQNCGARVWPVGRLDLDSEGLLLMTNDGTVTDRVMHPRGEVEKEYWATVEGDIAQALPILAEPMMLDSTELRAAKVWVLGPGRISVTIHEGKKRQVRRMCAVAGLLVTRLRRVREGKLKLGGLAAGQWRSLTQDEIAYLRSL